MSPGLLDNESLDLTCPECDRPIRATIADARRSRTVRCSAGHAVELNGRDLDRSLRPIDDAFKKLGGS